MITRTIFFEQSLDCAKESWVAPGLEAEPIRYMGLILGQGRPVKVLKKCFQTPRNCMF